MVREVGAPAAEVAAAAGVKPVAHRVADATEDVGQRLARRASDVASDLRRSVSGEGASASTATAEPVVDTASPTAPAPAATPPVETTSADGDDPAA